MVKNHAVDVIFAAQICKNRWCRVFYDTIFEILYVISLICADCQPIKYLLFGRYDSIAVIR